jgi:hypothetical protein
MLTTIRVWDFGAGDEELEHCQFCFPQYLIPSFSTKLHSANTSVRQLGYAWGETDLYLKEETLEGKPIRKTCKGKSQETPAAMLESPPVVP